MLGSLELVAVEGLRARGRRNSEGRLQPEPEGLGVDRHHDIAVCRDRVLVRRQRIAAVAEQLRVQQRLLSAGRAAGEGHLGEAARGRRAIGGLERKRHLRPRPLGSCHRGLLRLSGSGQRVSGGVVQNYRDHGRLQAGSAFHRKVYGPRASASTQSQRPPSVRSAASAPPMLAQRVSKAESRSAPGRD